MSYRASLPPWHIPPGRRAHQGWERVSEQTLELKWYSKASYLNTAMS